MTPTAQLADYVLPAASCFEKPFLVGGDYWSAVIGGEAALTPQYERKTEYFFWRELGMRLGQKEYWPWENLEEAYDHILSPLNISFKDFIARGGFVSAPHEFKKYERTGFGTSTGKFELFSPFLEDLGCDSLPVYYEPPQSEISLHGNSEYPMKLITGGRIRPYHHSGSRQIESVRKRAPDPLAEINPKTAAELEIADGEWLWIETCKGRSKHKCKHFSWIDTDVIHVEHGWWYPEEPGEEPSLHGLWCSNINVVLDDNGQFLDPVRGLGRLKEEYHVKYIGFINNDRRI